MADGSDNDDSRQQTSGGHAHSRSREARPPQPATQRVKLPQAGIGRCARRGQTREDAAFEARRRRGIAHAAEDSLDGGAGAGIGFGIDIAVHR
jgi:hypothetical protein